MSKVILDPVAAPVPTADPAATGGQITVLATTFSWLTQTIGVPTVLVAVSVFSIMVLLDADAIQAVLADLHPIWVQMVKPAAWALLIPSVGRIALLLWRLIWPRKREDQSPEFKLRSTAEDVDALVKSLSNDENYNRDAQGGLGPPSLCLETEIATLKGKLESIGVHSPPSSEVAAWQNYLPMLRGWVAAGDLPTARWYRPGTTAIVGWRRSGIGS